MARPQIELQLQHYEQSNLTNEGDLKCEERKLDKLDLVDSEVSINSKKIN